MTKAASSHKSNACPYRSAARGEIKSVSRSEFIRLDRKARGLHSHGNTYLPGGHDEYKNHIFYTNCYTFTMSKSKPIKLYYTNYKISFQTFSYTF